MLAGLGKGEISPLGLTPSLGHGGGNLSLLCTRSAGKGFWAALARVCRCRGPAEPLGTATPSLRSILPTGPPPGETAMGSFSSAWQSCSLPLYC